MRLAIAACFAAILAIGFVLAWMYLSREQRANRNALRFLDETNYSAASLSARRALQINSNSVAACRVMAEIAEHCRVPQALEWRERVTKAEPENSSNYLEFARTALAFGALEKARQVLAAFPAEQQAMSADYHAVAAQVAFNSGDIETAETHLIRAGALDPAAPAHAHSLAIVQLHSADPKTVEAARLKLDAARRDPTHGTAILRALTREAWARHETGRALEYSLELQERADSQFEDRINHLALLYSQIKNVSEGEPQSRESEQPSPAPSDRRHSELAFSEFLLRTQREAGRNASRIAVLTNWLTDHQLPDEALAWLESLPNELRTATSVRLAEAECYLVKQNWRELGSMLSQAKWGQDDHLRHAILALSYRQQGEEPLAQIEWKRAVRATHDGARSAQNSEALIRLAGTWAWREEAERLLWDVAGEGANRRWALGVLQQFYEIGGDTRSLLRVFATSLKQDPNDVVARNNFAAAALLLRTNLPAAYQLAREGHAAVPTNTALACTYAYSLHLQGRTDEGLRILSKFPRESLQNPGTAAYLGVLLAAKGASEQAQKYFAHASNGFLLPEEKSLVQTAAQLCKVSKDSPGISPSTDRIGDGVDHADQHSSKSGATQ
jgi:tetratricopeptide (TPR) repeat protein